MANEGMILRLVEGMDVGRLRKLFQLGFCSSPRSGLRAVGIVSGALACNAGTLDTALHPNSSVDLAALWAKCGLEVLALFVATYWQIAIG